MQHHLCMAQRCMHIAEKRKRKPSPHTPIHFVGLPQCAQHLARHDEIGLCPMLQEYQVQHPAKSTQGAAGCPTRPENRPCWCKICNNSLHRSSQSFSPLQLHSLPRSTLAIASEGCYFCHLAKDFWTREASGAIFELNPMKHSVAMPSSGV